MTVTDVATAEELQAAYDGSYYTIAGAGGDLRQWVGTITGKLALEGAGRPAAWFATTGAAVNSYAGQTADPFPPDLVILMFPLTGLDITKLAAFKIRMNDRWFDDIIDAMRRA